jgi:hypothetical protein
VRVGAGAARDRDAARDPGPSWSALTQRSPTRRTVNLRHGRRKFNHTSLWQRLYGPQRGAAGCASSNLLLTSRLCDPAIHNRTPSAQPLTTDTHICSSRTHSGVQGARKGPGRPVAQPSRKDCLPGKQLRPRPLAGCPQSNHHDSNAAIGINAERKTSGAHCSTAAGTPPFVPHRAVGSHNAALPNVTCAPPRANPRSKGCVSQVPPPAPCRRLPPLNPSWFRQLSGFCQVTGQVTRLALSRPRLTPDFCKCSATRYISSPPNSQRPRCDFTRGSET